MSRRMLLVGVMVFGFGMLAVNSLFAGDRDDDRKKVLILCTGNSCRSIMSEAFINHYMGDEWVAYSAGVNPSKVNWRARQVLAEVGVFPADPRSKHVSEFVDRDDLDLVITVCDHAKETCPVFLNPVEQVHIGFQDPATWTEYPDSVALPVFRHTRELIRESILSELERRSE